MFKSFLDCFQRFNRYDLSRNLKKIRCRNIFGSLDQTCFLFFGATMSEPTHEPSLIEDLEKRQDSVLEQIDELNDKIEDTLNNIMKFRKETEPVEETQLSELKDAA